MKKFIISLIILLFAVNSFSQSDMPELLVNGGKSYKYVPNFSSGLNLGCYVVQRDIPVSFRFVSNSTEPMNLYSFSTSGVFQKELITTAVQQGGVLTFTGGKKDCGYVIEQDGVSYNFWVSGYVQTTNLEIDYSYTNMCNSARLTGDGITIPYYNIYGAMEAFPRNVKYNTWVWNDEDEMLETSVEVSQENIKPSIDDKLVIDSPYEKTYITLVDDIPTYWGETVKEITTTEEFVPQAIFLKGVVTQLERDADNEIEVDTEDGSYGGSAPVNMVFEAYVNEDNYFCWQFFKSDKGPDDEDPVVYATYLDQTLNYTFKEAGTVYVRLHAENATCSKNITYTISVSESFIDVPNAFSPGTSPGVNDEWRVAYKSIVEFKCSIFDRWGIKMYSFEDPSAGWDGNYKGKLVPPGVYFYVIQAKGSDGQEYELKGHINILRAK